MKKMWIASSFSLDIPEVYQVELTNSCQLDCVFCIRKDPRVKREVGFLDPKLIHLMIKRGDFKGSYFTELQGYGEPLLAPFLEQVIQDLHTVDIKVGLSTNGLLIDRQLTAVQQLDYLTVSLDTADKGKYESQRKGSDYSRILSNISLLLEHRIRPMVDIQVINFGQDNNLLALTQLAEEKGWGDKVTIRSVPDCFAAYQNRPYPVMQKIELCLNPWISVSVHWDGSVHSCCFCAGEDNFYGNLYEYDLRTIWKNSQGRQELMTNMRTNFNINQMPCKFCYMRSPALFHLKMAMEQIKKGD